LPITDPKVKIYNVLVANWAPANTSNVTPKIHMGHYNTAWEARPQITIVGPRYDVLRGGSTGITAFNGAGASVRVTEVEMFVSCWAHHEMKDNNGAAIGVNPRQLTYEMSHEVKRILESNMFTDSELDWMNWTGMVEGVEMKIKPVLFRYTNTVRLMYREAF